MGGIMTNLLQNGNFTGGAYHYTEWGHQVNEVQLPTGWGLFEYDHGSDFHRPETKVQVAHQEPSLTDMVWKVFSTYSRHHCSLGQRVQVAVGTDLRLDAWVYAWSSDADTWGESEGGSYRVRVGIDPYGCLFSDSPDIQWSHPGHGYKAMSEYVHLDTKAIAEAGVVTVWLQGDAEWAVKHNDAFWDSASLTAISTPAPGDPDLERWQAGMEARMTAIEAQLAGYGTVEARIVVETH